MRFMVEPPRLARCTCGGDMRLKQIEPGERALGKQNETFVCGKCGRQHSYAVDPNPYAAGASIRFR